MSAPVLSVVTPSFNSGRYIAETLASVAQLRTPHEHLVMDGGSTDETLGILEARDDASLSWVSEPDRGQTHAVNKGFERGSGDFLAWINADDAYVPEAVDRAVAFLEANPDVAALYGFMDIMDEDSRVTRHYRPPPFNWRRYLYMGDYVTTPTIVFRSSFIAAVGYLDERYSDAADYDFYLRLMHGRRVERMAEPLLRFRYHADSKTAVDQDLGQREALAIRLKWARNGRDAAVMRGLDATKQRVYKLVNPWPPNRHVTRLVDTAAQVRERVIAGR